MSDLYPLEYPMIEIIAFRKDGKAQILEDPTDIIDFPLIWFDIDRSQPNWYEAIKTVIEFEIDEKHLLDSLNELHPSFFDGTQGYDMVIFRGLCQGATVEKLKTEQTAFFLFEHCLITVHSQDNLAVQTVKKRLLSNGYKTHHLPFQPMALMHQILDVMVTQFLVLREPLSEKLDSWRLRLVHNNFREWASLINHKRQLRKLEILGEQQVDTLMGWREETREVLDESLMVRYNDLVEHVHRVLNHVKNLQNEIEFLIQLHFSVQSQRTNQTIVLLTLVSIVFLPLNLIASIFGMNFAQLPLLENSYGFFYVLGSMGLLAGSLLWWFKWNRWL